MGGHLGLGVEDAGCVDVLVGTSETISGRVLEEFWGDFQSGKMGYVLPVHSGTERLRVLDAMAVCSLFRYALLPPLALSFQIV